MPSIPSLEGVCEPQWGAAFLSLRLGPLGMPLISCRGPLLRMSRTRSPPQGWRSHAAAWQALAALCSSREALAY